MLLAMPLKSMSRLAAENAALRYQLAMLRRKLPGRVQPTNGDRLFLILLYRWFPSVLDAIKIISRALAPCRVPPVLALENPTPLEAGRQLMRNCGH